VRFSGVQLSFFQSNIEGELINQLQSLANTPCGGIVLNAAAYTHTSIALADTLKAIKTPVILVHISNVFAREEERKTDLLVSSAKGLICGLGLQGYDLAIRALL
jgi:3-dehydroquinate dehydratase-2